MPSVHHSISSQVEQGFYNQACEQLADTSFSIRNTSAMRHQRSGLYSTKSAMFHGQLLLHHLKKRKRRRGLRYRLMAVRKFTSAPALSMSSSRAAFG
jgi:hypothetical protein